MLNITGIDVYYGRVRALDGVSIHVPEGKIVTLLGANGAGKSTTLKAVSGILPVAQGEISFIGKPLNGVPAEEIVSLGVIHVPEGRQIFAHLTVEENLRIGLYARKDKWNFKTELEHALNYFPALATRLAQKGGTLSGGEQQMLAIARGLMGKPRLLILDEPSLGLAPKIVADIFTIIRRLNKEGTTVLLVEQNANMALKTADYAYVLEIGRVVMAGEASVLLKDDRIRRSYLGGHG
ncbi:ABC transporter ATP-binding protein [Anaerosporomusa subterranea]|uniref:ABC transporter ATP-binding protein n=1 Tax=Anaerosporomusa subterranea TaxID=1794912 RepID=A0A154BPI8_ANASB|nr:ABC transporter ATP-binding protein [Anaerosporomusa subterranea]KYZ75821.1 ABC transporter ATP-binding protein [Anaerosporomusa subterranea]